jgi:hypothetical protein
MKKLSLFAIAGLAALAGCPGSKDKDKPKDDKTAPAPSAKPDEAKGDPTKTDPAKPDETKKDETKKDETKKDEIAGLPAACTDYKAAVDKAAACEKLGAQRDQLKADLAKSWEAWSKLDDKGKAALEDSCKQLTTTVNTALAACK